jgi:Asp-tRNA(Asn)/Glu-tRNA(Gln) amidotransferase C subunit
MDPGTALGSISLGIEVCKGVLAYCRAWNEHKADIEQTSDKIAFLYLTLSDLSVILRKGSQTSLTDHAQGCLTACRDDIQRLDRKLTKMRKEAPNGMRQKAHASGIRFMYPFKKSAFLKLEEIAQQLVEQLKLAIDAIQLDNSFSVQYTADQIKSVVDDNMTMNTKTHAITLATQTQVSTIETSLQPLLSAEQARTLDTIIQWLDAPNPSENHAQARREHEPGTGEWLFKSRAYQDWLSGSSPLLWMHGKAGCCKTIMCSTIIEDVKRRISGQHSAAFAYFYFTFSETRKQSYSACLCSMITQLSRGHSAHALLHSTWSQTKRDRPSIQLLEDVLSDLLKEADTPYLVVDALDECSEEEREQVLEGFKRITQAVPKTRLLMTSRREIDIEDLMTSWCKTWLRITEAAVNEDIEIFIKNALATNKKLVKLRSDTKKKIEEVFREKSEGI